MAESKQNYLQWRNRTTTFLQTNPSFTRICLVVRHMATLLDNYEEMSDLIDEMRYLTQEEEKAHELANTPRRPDPQPETVGQAEC